MTTRSRFGSVRKAVLEDDNLLSCILANVDTDPNGWSFRQWAAVSAVCKRWRQEMLRQPVHLYLVKGVYGADPATPAEGLLSCPAPVRTLSYAREAAALALLQDPGFQQRNGHCLRRLDSRDPRYAEWTLQLILQLKPPYPLLQELTVDTTDPDWQQDSAFNSACLSGLTRLTSLTLLDCETTPDLSHVPASLKHVTLTLPDYGGPSDPAPFGRGLRLPDGIRLHSLQILGEQLYGRRQSLRVDASALLLAEDVSVLMVGDAAPKSVSVTSHWSYEDFWTQLAASPVQRLNIQARDVRYVDGRSEAHEWQISEGRGTVLGSMGLQSSRQPVPTMDTSTMGTAVRAIVQRVGFQRPPPPVFGPNISWKPSEQDVPILLTTEVPIARLDLRSVSSCGVRELLTHPTFLAQLAPHVKVLRGIQLDGVWLSLVANSYPKLERLQIMLQPDPATWAHGAWVPSSIKHLELFVTNGPPNYCARWGQSREVPNTAREVVALLKRAANRKAGWHAQALEQAVNGLPYTVASITE